MKLISMTDFILDQEKKCIEFHKDYGRSWDYGASDFRAVLNYVKFLKQPLKLEMFVPCDEDGNVLEEYKRKPSEIEADLYNYPRPVSIEEHIWNKAKEKVLFKDATVMPVEDYYIVKIGKREVWITWTERTIEDIQHINRAYEVDFELTESAINQLGL